MQSNVNMMETEEPNCSKTDTLDKSDVEDATIEHQSDNVDSETKMTSSLEPHIFQVAESFLNLPPPEPSSELYGEETLCEEVKIEDPQSLAATVDEITELPAKKTVKRRMGMCGLGDRKRRLCSGGQNSRQISIGRLTEQGAEQAACKDCVDAEERTTIDDTLVTGLETTMEEKRELDDPGTVKELHTANIKKSDCYMTTKNEGTAGDTPEKNGCFEEVDETTVGVKTLNLDGIAEGKSSQSTLMNTDEERRKENISVENDGSGLDTGLEEPGELISDYVEDNQCSEGLDNEGLEPDLEDEGMITDTVNENQGSKVADDKITTEDSSKVGKSNSSEEYGVSVVLTDKGTMGEHEEGGSALMNDGENLPKPLKDQSSDEKNFDIDEKEIGKIGDESKEEPGAPIENGSSLPMAAEGTLGEGGDYFETVPIQDQIDGSAFLKVLDQDHSNQTYIFKELVQGGPYLTNDRELEACDEEPKLSGMLNRHQNIDLNEEELDAPDRFFTETNEVMKPEDRAKVSNQTVEVPQEIHRGYPEVLLAPESPHSSVTCKVSHEPGMFARDNQPEPSEQADGHRDHESIGQECETIDDSKGAELPEAKTTSRTEEEELAQEESNCTEEERVNGAPPSGQDNNTHQLVDPMPNPAAGLLARSSTLPSLNSVTDSWLHSITESLEIEDRFLQGGFEEEEEEDATELVRGLVRELSSLNRTVMAAHREMELLRRGNRLLKPPARRSSTPRTTEL